MSWWGNAAIHDSPNPGKSEDMVVTMGYQREYGPSSGQAPQAPGQAPESYETNIYDSQGTSNPQPPTEPAARRDYETVYDREADYAAVGPRGSSRGKLARAERRNLPLLVGGGFVTLVLLVAAGVMLSKAFGGGEKTASGAAESGQPGTTAPQSPAAGALPTGPLGAMLRSRATDPRPLTLREVFGRKSFTVSGVRYVMTTRHATRACTKTVHGAKLVSAMRTGGCNQVLRASFATADGKLAGTVGVANLKTARAASATAKLSNGAKDAYVVPLPGGGVTRTLGKGIAFASAEARGHYVVLSWIQAPNGKAIPQSRRKAATTFGPSVTYGSRLGFALQYRGIAGKPYGT
jgi:hypothetical protein